MHAPDCGNCAIDAADCDAFVASVHLTVAVVYVMGYRSCAVNTHLFLAAKGNVQDWHWPPLTEIGPVEEVSGVANP